MNWETKAKSFKLNAGWWMQRSSFRCRCPFSISKCPRASLIRALWKMETEVVVFWDVFLNNWPPVMWLTPQSPALGPCTSWDCQCESCNPTRKYYSTGKSRRLSLDPTLNQKWTGISIHTLPLPQPVQLLPQTPSLLLLASAGSLDDFLEVTGEQDS